MSFTFIAVSSAFFAAIANILARVLLKKFKSSEILSVNFFIMAVTLLLISPLFYKFEANVTSVSLILLISVIDIAGNYFYFKTFEKTEASIATPILSLAPAFTFLSGWLLLGDVVNFRTYFLAASVIILVIIFSIDFKKFQTFKFNTLFPALSSSLLFGISAIPLKILLNGNTINAPTLYMFRAFFISIFALFLFRKSVKRLAISDYWFIFIRGLFVIIQYVLLYVAISRGNVGVSVTLGNITPIFVFILSMFFLREKPTLKKIITCVLVFAVSIII